MNTSDHNTTVPKAPKGHNSTQDIPRVSSFYCVNSRNGHRIFMYASPNRPQSYVLMVRNDEAQSCNCWASRTQPETPCKHRQALTAFLQNLRSVKEVWRENATLFQECWDYSTPDRK